ncbi:helix-turn-helix domain-containing protein [Actinoplanes sp. NPDC051861]|uniref:nSTAND1 domain-containing NTPase n=1 Tax=Actinoplanes sp. NPDC051861 TaxID=3155170 RepID=UPI003427D16C
MLVDPSLPRTPESVTDRDEFAAALTELREQAGRTVRDVAKLSGLPTSTIGGYFGGRHLPPLKPPDVMPRLLAACGVSDPDEVSAWVTTLNRIRRAPGPRPAGAPVPYQGLASFQPEDADRFFGREELTATVIQRLREPGPPRPMIVVGASGAGKSSLLRAGVVAGLRRDGEPIELLTPGPNPMRRLVVPGSGVLVVDQFEEVFTLCSDPGERAAFIGALCETRDLRIVLGLRADFYAEALRIPVLADALARSQVIVPPMTLDGLRRAITEPARGSRIDVEDGLVELLLRDLVPTGGEGVHEAGSLPLLSHVLLATYELGHGRRLTVSDYRAAGGLHGSVARTADNLYAELDQDEREIARQLFVSLVQVSENGPDTRRQASAGELERIGTPRAAVLDKFIARRLITVEQDTIGISHEALLHAWPRLREWIEADRADLVTARRLTEAADVWHREHRDPAALYQGARLTAARDWLAGGNAAGPLVTEFVEAGLRRGRKRTIRLYQTVVVLVVLLAVAATAGIVAVQQQHTAETQRNLAISRLVATRADRVRETDVALAAQLSLVAKRIGDTPEARASLIDASATVAATRMLGGSGVMQSVSYSPGRQLVAAGNADATVRLWDLSDQNRPRQIGVPLIGPSDVVYSTAFSPDGTLLAAGSGDRLIRIWDVTDPGAPREVATLDGPSALVYSVAFSPDGRLLGAGSGDNTLHLYDARSFRAITRITGLSGFVQAVAFRPDGREVAAGLADGSVRLWDLADPDRPAPRDATLTGPAGKVFGVAYSPDGDTLAAGSADKRVYLWRRDGGGPLLPAGAPLAGVDSWVNGVAFSPDSRRLALASSDGTAQVWDLSRRVAVARLTHPGPVTAVAFSGARLLTSAADGVVRLWRLPGPVLTGMPDVINGVAFRPDGKVLAVAGGDVTFFDPHSHERLGASLPALGGAAGAVGYSPDGNILAVGHRDGSIQLYDVTDPLRPTRSGPPLPAHDLLIESLAFSPDGRTLATAGDDNLVKLWNVSDPARPAPRSTAAVFKSYVYAVRFSPDGSILAAGSVDKTALLIDVRDPDHPVPLGSPLRGPDHYVMALAFSPDGRLLAMGSGDHTARLYDIADPANPRRVGPVLEGPANYVYALSFAPDGRTLAGAVTDGTVWLWNTSDPARPSVIATLVVPEKALYTVAFARDGRTLAAGGRTATIWMWDTDMAAGSAAVCEVSGDPLSPSEWARHVPSLPYRPPC